jgi:hypothetical protein
MKLIGRRRPDLSQDDLHSDIQRGDYWKLLDADGTPLKSDAPSNLTGTCWMAVAPIGDGDGFAIGTLRLHTVREEDDGTISVRPGDGSSNSILMSRGASGASWHGYIEHGVWDGQ